MQKNDDIAVQFHGVEDDIIKFRLGDNITTGDVITVREDISTLHEKGLELRVNNDIDIYGAHQTIRLLNSDPIDLQALLDEIDADSWHSSLLFLINFKNP